MNNEVLTIDNACLALLCGRTHLYKLINNGDIKALKMGKKTLVTRSSINEFIASLEPYQLSSGNI